MACLGLVLDFRDFVALRLTGCRLPLLDGGCSPVVEFSSVSPGEVGPATPADDAGARLAPV